jgi:hypothetical protein
LGRDQLAEAASRAATEINDNPRPVDEPALLGLLERAFAGERPANIDTVRPTVDAKG